MLDVVTDGLPAMGQETTDETPEELLVDPRVARIDLPHLESKDRRDYPGARAKGVGRDAEEHLDPGGSLGDDGEESVFLGPRLRGETLRDLALKHEDELGETLARAQKAQKDRRRDGVGKVPDDADLSRGMFLDQASKVEPQGIVFENLGSAVEGKRASELFRESAIGLDGDDARSRARERKSELALTGADLDQSFARSRCYRLYDPLDVALVAEEALALRPRRVKAFRHVRRITRAA
jgi:hypothetical protein